MKITLPSYPLLAKELTEQANRKRTYVIRVLLLAVMSTALVIFLLSGASSDSHLNVWSMRRLGTGIMLMVVVCQFIAVLVLLPASMACVLTSEKERNSLELLLLTNMSPWAIIQQKYFSRIIPTLMFLFLSLPMVAIAYSFGGLDVKELKWIFAELFFLIFYIGAWGILWSAFCRSSVMAVVFTYLSLVFSFICFLIFMPGNIFRRYDYMDEETYFVIWFVLQAISVLTNLPVALTLLKRRVTPKKGNPFLRFLHILDRFWKEINSFFGGVEIIKSQNYKLPDNDPIAWYEKYKRPTGRLHYMARIVMLLSIPSLFLAVTCCFFPDTYQFGYIIGIAIWVIIAIVMMVKSTSIIADERSNQTLDILLTTSVTPKQLVTQRMSSLARFRFALSIPLFFTIILIAYFSTLHNSYRWHNHNYAYVLLTCSVVHLSFLTWFCCWIGLKIKSLRKAIITVFISITLWVFLPFLPWMIAELKPSFSRYSLDVFEGVAYFSPLMPIGSMENRNFHWTAFIVTSVVILGLYIFLKVLCLNQAEVLLRNPSSKRLPK